MDENKSFIADLKLDFDPDALREKYLASATSVSAPTATPSMSKSPASSPITSRPLCKTDSPRPAQGRSRRGVIGGGFGGLLAGARFHEAGIKDVRIIESGGDFGGTWYWNRYPGAQCDIESYCYLPLVEELGYVPKEKYSFAPEIYEHSRRIAKHYNLYENALFQTKVRELRWDEEAARWIVSTDRGDAMRARFVVMATGPLNRPKLPGYRRHRGDSKAIPSTPAAGITTTPAATTRAA